MPFKYITRIKKLLPIEARLIGGARIINRRKWRLRDECHMLAMLMYAENNTYPINVGLTPGISPEELLSVAALCHDDIGIMRDGDVISARIRDIVANVGKYIDNRPVDDEIARGAADIVCDAKKLALPGVVDIGTLRTKVARDIAHEDSLEHSEWGFPDGSPFK